MDIMSIDDAKRILRRRNLWCHIALKRSIWYRFTNWLSDLPIIWKFGTSIRVRYLQLCPKELIATATMVIMVNPIIRRVDYENIGKSIISIRDLG